MAQMPFTPCSAEPCEDVTVNILQSVFGPVIRSLTQGKDPGEAGIDPAINVIAMMMSYFNSGILVVASIILSYTVVIGVVNTANDGEAFGKNWSSVWTPMRIVAGGAVLLPTGTGYSFIQLMTMMISLWGIGFANGAFDLGVRNGILGGTLQNVSQQVEASDGTKSVNKNYPLYNMREFAGKYLANAYCAKTINSVYKNAAVMGLTPPDVRMRNAADANGAGADVITPWGDKTVYTYQLKDRSTSGLAGGAQICGAVDLYKYNPHVDADPASGLPAALDVVSKAFGIDSKNANSRAMALLRDAVLASKLSATNTMIQEIDSWVLQWPDNINENWEHVNSNEFNQIVDRAQSNIISSLNSRIQSDPTLKSMMDIFTKQIAKDGWSMAGGYYQRLGGIREEMRQIYTEPPGKVSGPSLVELTIDSSQNIVKYSIGMADSIVKKSVDGSGYSPTSVSDSSAVMSELDKNTLDKIDIDKLGSRGNGWLNSIVGKAMKSVTDSFTGVSGDTDAIARMKTSGDIFAVMNTTVNSIQFTAASAFAGAGVLAAPLDTTTNIVNSGRNFWMETFAKGLAQISSWLEKLAFYFGVFLPSLPYTIFMMAVVGWLLAVVQTIFAAPLWAIMHMSPERSFIGSQTQGYLMFVSLFVRPALIIVAMFAAMSLANPVILYMSKAFWSMRTAIVTSSESLGWFIQFITWKDWLVVYGIVMLPVIYLIYGLTNSLPEQVLTWISAGIKPMGETQAMDETRRSLAAHGAAGAAGAASRRLGGGGSAPGQPGAQGNPKLESADSGRNKSVTHSDSVVSPNSGSGAVSGGAQAGGRGAGNAQASTATPNSRRTTSAAAGAAAGMALGHAVAGSPGAWVGDKLGAAAGGVFSGGQSVVSPAAQDSGNPGGTMAQQMNADTATPPTQEPSSEPAQPPVNEKASMTSSEATTVKSESGENKMNSAA